MAILVLLERVISGLRNPHKTQPAQPIRIECNYRDDYYGDRCCQAADRY